MTERTRFARYAAGVALTLLLSGCLDGDSDEDAAVAGPQVTITNPAGAEEIQTPDIVVNLIGTASSSAEIESVAWTNDRGGYGFANGKESWVTGNIVLQIGANLITLTATDVEGNTSSKDITVQRENPAAPAIDEPDPPQVLYSYTSDLANSAPVAGANISPGRVYLTFVPGANMPAETIARVEYLCCKGISGPGEGMAFSPALAVSIAPWSMTLDWSGLEPGGTRRLRADIHFRDGSEPATRVFDFTVAGDASNNRPPVISGNPRNVATVGIAYSFRPTATDADGDSLRFTIQNKPSWATFNRSTGRLSGTPQQGDVGNHRDILIAVSDGKATSSLSAYTIYVEPMSSGTATITWNPPTERTDGTSLGGGLAGFEIHYGQSPDSYSNVVALNNPGLSSHVVENLAPGTWHFALVAIDSDQQKSAFSNQKQITIP